MELSGLKGNIVGIISDDFKEENIEGKVRDVVFKKTSDALKMVCLDDSILDTDISELSSRVKRKVILASKLQDKEIVLVNFTKGLTKKDIDFFKVLFKRIVGYNRRIFLIDKNSYLFLNCVDNLYVINNKNVILDTNDIFDERLKDYIDLPKIVEFILDCANKGIKINHYHDIDELLKAIYRIKS